jgi:hypothetical protein
MSDQLRPQDAARLLLQLERTKEGRHREVAGVQLDPQLALLRAWQVRRLAVTHADLQASPRFGPTCRFFLSDIYAPRDFSQRDRDIQQIYEFMQSIFPARMLQTLTLTLELYHFTLELDQQLLRAMVDKLGLTDTVTAELYAAGYRMCDNYADRVRQIELTDKVGRAVDRLVGLPLVGITLRLAHGPARRAGWHELQSFFERGYAAFKHMRGADPFLSAVRQRETRILDQIFAGAPDPFNVS